MSKKKSHRPRAGERKAPAQQPSPKLQASWFARHPVLTALGVFAVIMFVFFFEIIFAGKTYLSPDAQAPAALSAPLQKIHDQEGFLPQWAPYIFAGLPSAGGLIYTPYSYFPNIILAPLGQFVRGAVFTAFYYALAGLGVFLFVRRKGAAFIPALFGGLAFMLTPYLITMTIFGHGSQMMTAAYIPLALWASDRLLEKFSLLNLGAAALILGLMLQRGHIQIAYYGLMLTGFYLLYHVLMALRQKETRRLAPMLGGFLGAGVLAFALAAILFLPLREYTPYSIRGMASALETAAEKTEEGVGFDYATQWSFSPGEMMTFILPSFYGFGGFTYWGNMPFTDYPNYMGILVLALAIFGLYKRVPQAGFFAAAIVLALLISFGHHWPWFYKIFYNYFPYFNKFRVPAMILVLVQCLTAVLAGLGLQALLQPVRENGDREQAAQQRLFARRLWLGVPGILAVILLLTLGRSVFFELMRGFYPDVYDAQTQMQLDTMRFNLLLGDLWIVGVILCAGLSAAALAYSKKISAAAAAAAIAILTLIDLWIVDKRIGADPVPERSFTAFLQKDEAAAFVQQDRSPFRIFPVADLFGELRWAAHEIESVGGYHAAKPRRYQDLLDATQLQNGFLNDYFRQVNQNGRRALQPLAPQELPQDRHLANRRLLDLLNAKYIFSFYPLPEGEWANRKTVNYERDGNARPMVIYENTTVLPRAYLVGEYEHVASDRVALARLRAGDFDPHRTVLLSEKPARAPQPDATAQASIIKYELHEIAVETVSQFPQILVLSDNYYPICWRAFVDGQPVKLLRANHAFSAVEIPPGKHVVEFRYSSRAMMMGTMTSVSALLFALACLGLGWRKQRASVPGGV